MWWLSKLQGEEVMGLRSRKESANRFPGGLIRLIVCRVDVDAVGSDHRSYWVEFTI